MCSFSELLLEDSFMSDQGATAPGALAAAEWPQLQSGGGTASQRMAAAHTDDGRSPFESIEGPEEAQHATITSTSAAAAAGSRGGAGMSGGVPRAARRLIPLSYLRKIISPLKDAAVVIHRSEGTT